MKYLTILLSLLTVFSLKADDILVNGSGMDGTYTTISDAISAANSGDRILIAPQDLPYQEDLTIDKDLTIMPAATNSFISFPNSSTINIILDNISELTIIGFRGAGLPNIQGQVNDLSTNIYSIINIIDCHLEDIKLDFPKTSLYLSYSEVTRVAFAHGDLIGNKITNKILFGLFDYDNISQIYESTFPQFWDFWPSEEGLTSPDGSYYPNSQFGFNELNNKFITECQLLENSIPFGEAQVYSDTCRFIANQIGDSESSSVAYLGLVIFNQDFPFDIRNNKIYENVEIYLNASSDKGVSRYINNTHGYYNRGFIFKLAYCNDSLSNFLDFSLNIFNNDGDYYYCCCNYDFNCFEDFRVIEPMDMDVSVLDDLTINTKGKLSYNFEFDFYANQFLQSLFDVGVEASSAYPNPSLEYLNLDLTPNTPGMHGGSHSWTNYYGSSSDNLAGKMPSGAKARITYLNLPTQIYDASTNINIKAKSIHGN